MVKLADIKPGDKLVVTDTGFDCLKKGDELKVWQGRSGLSVTCDDGEHLLDGQKDPDGNLLGLELVSAELPS